MLLFFLETAKKKYDLVVIGGGSGGLACSKEGRVYNQDLPEINIFIYYLLFNRSAYA